MKRRLILLAILIALLAAFGALLHSPPSFLDVVTGATPRAKKAAQANAQLKGKYIFCVNPTARHLTDPSRRDELKAFVSGKTKTIAANDLTLTIYVSETDYALTRYAEKLCTRFKKAGVSARLKTYSDTMLRSRAVSGKYEVFLAADDLLNVSRLKQADYIRLNSTAMKRASK